MTRDIRDFRVSKYAISTFKEVGSCKRKWLESVVLKSIPKDPPSEQMIKGIYFETMCFGANASGDELPDMSFMMLKNGEPNIELQRIHTQVDRFKSLFTPTSDEFVGIYMKEFQSVIETDKNKIVTDIIGVDEFDRDVIVDLKFTSDVSQSFGDFAWGKDPSQIDWSQMVLYSKVYEEVRGIKPRMFTLVFDASKNLGVKMFEVKVSQTAIEEIEDITDVVLSSARKYVEDGAPVRPSESNCSKCPIECSSRFVKPLVDKVKVYV